MSAMYCVLEGEIVLEGCAPDGDSLRFLPRAPDALGALWRSSLLERSRRPDGSVQIRLEGIDAPELHYEGAAQPRGVRARDALLAWLGIDPAQVRIRCLKRRGRRERSRDASSCAWRRGQLDDGCCSVEGGGTVMGPSGRSSWRASSRARVRGQYFGASSR